VISRIDTALLLPMSSGPVADASVLIDDRIIAFAGPTADLPADAPPAEARVPVLMPGLWDAHCHLFGTPAFSLRETLTTPPATAAARAVKDLEAAINAGFTSVREAGGLGIWLAPVVDEGTIIGPAIYAAGGILSPTGGHGDQRDLPHEWILDSCERGSFVRICDGVPECLRQVRLQLRAGARVIKICTSGGASNADTAGHRHFSKSELQAIVEEAGNAERAVMAHAHSKAGIMAALDAGVLTIEHGSGLDEESAAAMRELGAIYVPTLTIVGYLLASHGEQRFREIAERAAKAVSIAHAAGVTIASGSDLGSSGATSAAPWGTNGREPELLRQAGLSATEALAAATVNGPMTLGPQAPKSGALRLGYDADLIALTADPTADLAILADPENITHVWKQGALAKQPGRAQTPAAGPRSPLRRVP
jgi:imidazolonepropionase-like amidohydrolase